MSDEGNTPENPRAQDVKAGAFFRRVSGLKISRPRRGLNGVEAKGRLGALIKSAGGVGAVRASGKSRRSFLAAAFALLDQADGRALTALLCAIVETVDPRAFNRQRRALRYERNRRREGRRRMKRNRITSRAAAARARLEARPPCELCGTQSELLNAGRCVGRNRCNRRAKKASNRLMET